MATVERGGWLILNTCDKDFSSCPWLTSSRMTPKLCPSAQDPAVKNVIWYLCLKLLFIFNTLNLKLEVVKLFQVYRDRNPKEKEKFKVIELYIATRNNLICFISPFYCPSTTVSVCVKVPSFFFMKLLLPQAKPLRTGVSSGPECWRIQRAFYQHHN